MEIIYYNIDFGYTPTPYISRKLITNIIKNINTCRIHNLIPTSIKISSKILAYLEIDPSFLYNRNLGTYDPITSLIGVQIYLDRTIFENGEYEFQYYIETNRETYYISINQDINKQREEQLEKLMELIQSDCDSNY